MTENNTKQSYKTASKKEALSVHMRQIEKAAWLCVYTIIGYTYTYNTITMALVLKANVFMS